MTQTNSNSTDHNYWTPLTSQFKELETNHYHQIEIDDNQKNPEDNTTPENKKIKKRITKHHAKRILCREAIQQLSRRISNGNVSQHNWTELKNTMSAVYDLGATSHCGRENDDFIPTNQPSNKVFHLPTGHTTSASKQATLHHQVHNPARTVDIVPGLKHNSLLSASKFADANYITVLMLVLVL